MEDESIVEEGVLLCVRIQAAASSGYGLPVYASDAARTTETFCIVDRNMAALSLCVQFLMKNEEFMKTMVYY